MSRSAPDCPLALALSFVLALPAASFAAAQAPAPKPADAAAPADDPLLASLEWREVGPYRGGRSAAVAGLAAAPQTYYFGATGGGVWKTTDGGGSWINVSDGFFGGSIGAVAVSDWDPNVVYAGGGEVTVRGNVSWGDGVWKSTDAGESWKHVGLPQSRHVPRIRLHPKNPDRVYAAVLGDLFAASDERGVYRTDDGGKTWKRILFANREAGAVDLAMDPTNPRILYASTWRVRRSPWSLESGGLGSGLWKTTDGGDTWSELTRKKGLPQGTVGIIGVTVSASDPRNLYAIVEAEDGGVFRSRDGGETWEKANDDRALRQRAWYYSRIVADPLDAETVWVLNVALHRSQDGGKSFAKVSTPHGDNHDLWIAPDDSRRLIEANDGGVNVSFDGGVTWSPQANQPTSQIYRLSVDDDFPYRLLGGQQDNSALRIRSRSFAGDRLGAADWEPTAGGESGHVVAKPGEPDVVYGGSYGGYLVRVDHRTAETRAVNVWPDDPMGWGAADQRYRFQWNFPLFFSPHDPDVLYAAANVLFKTTDGGATWAAISGDLTADDASKQGPSGGPITKDNTGVEVYATIFAAVESPREPGLLWTGSDDGRVHVSRDGGGTWSDVTPKAFPLDTMVNSLDVHPSIDGGLYLAATRYKSGDLSPYLLATTDYGATWRSIAGDLPKEEPTRVVRADPEAPGLLYAGSEYGVWSSRDDGKTWKPLQRNLPRVPITDLAVHRGDLIAATQGRGFWILDDLGALRQLAPAVADRAFALLDPEPAYRLATGRAKDPGAAGTNPYPGVVVHYWLKEAPAAGVPLKLEVLSSDGVVVRAFERKPSEATPKEEEKDEDRVSEDPRQLPAEKGMNRFVWDLRHAGAERFPGLVLWNDDLAGPRAVPGDYRLRLTLGEETRETTARVVADPRSSATPEDLAAQETFLLGVRDRLTALHREIARLRALRGDLDALRERLEKGGAEALAEEAKELAGRLTAVEEALYQTRNRSPQDPLNYPVRLNDKLAAVYGLAAIGDAAPTRSQVEVRDQLLAAIEVELSKLRRIFDVDVPAFDARVREGGVAVVAVPPPANG